MLKLLTIIFGGLCLAVLGCSGRPTRPEGSPCDQILRKEGWTLLSSGRPYALNSISMNGRDVFRFEIRAGDTWGPDRTHRAEISTQTFPPMGEEKWYRFSILVPADFPVENNRLVLAQWWAKTKKEQGEVSRSPILHLRFVNGKLQILLRRYAEVVALNDENYVQTNLFETTDFMRDSWHDFVFHVKWSPRSDGFIQVWMDEKQVIDFQGVSENQDVVGPVFKFGLYRDDSPNTYVVYFSNVSMSEHPEF